MNIFKNKKFLIKSETKNRKVLSKTKSRGFTLIEMLVVLAIFAILTSIVIFNYGDFNSNIVLTNMAYDVALATRQAQVFGLGSRGDLVGGDIDFSQPYGVYFNITSGDTDSFIFFTDTDLSGNCDKPNGSCACTGDLGVDECRELITLKRGIKIDSSNFRIKNAGGSCLGPADFDNVSIIFKRPNPNANITAFKGSQTMGGNINSFAQIGLVASNGNKKCIIVRESGQITVLSEEECTGNQYCPVN